MSYLELLKLGLPETIVAATAFALMTVQLALKRNRTNTRYMTLIALAGLAAAVAATALVLPVPWAPLERTAHAITEARHHADHHGVNSTSTPAAVNGVAGHAAKQKAPELVAPVSQTDLFGGMLVVSPLTSLFKIIVLLLAGCAVLLAGETRFTPHRGEYLALLLFATVGMMLLIGSEELLMIFIGLELTGLSLYVLAAFDKSNALGVEAGMKYFLFGSTASAFTLFGLSLIYGLCNSTNLAVIGAKIGVPHSAEPLLMAGVAMTLAGFAFKIAAAPFHPWAPDVYQAAPLPSAAFIASGSKVASFFVLGKLLFIGFGPAADSAAWVDFHGGWYPLVGALAGCSIIVGNITALAQRNLRRLLAYSAVAHTGYTLLGLLATGREGFTSTLFYTTTYAFTIVGAFGIIALVRRETGGDDIANFAGLGRRSPLLAVCMGIFLLSLAGLPPFVGFFGKFYLFTAILRTTQMHGAIGLVALAMAGSLVSLYYYLRVLKVMFVDPKADGSEPSAIGSERSQRIAIAFLGAATVILGAFPDLLIVLISNTLI